MSIVPHLKQINFFDTMDEILFYTPDEFKTTLNYYTTAIRDDAKDPQFVNYADYGRCYKIQKFIDILNNEYLPKIKENATKYQIQLGEAVDKGFMNPGLAYKADVGNVLFTSYFKHFCTHDPLLYNHNGTTRIEAIDRVSGDKVPSVQQNIGDFIDYFSSKSSLQAEITDALSYIWNPEDRSKVCSKYKMPSVLFTSTSPHYARVIAGPSIRVNRFGQNGAVLPNTDVVPGGGDEINLTAIGMLRGSNMWGKGNSTPFTADIYNSYFTFPNFLLGEMLYMSTPPTGTVRSKEIYVHRLFPNTSKDYLEFWVKHHGENDGSFPYDKKRYVLPEGWRMIERADGIIMYLSPENQLDADPPPGSYYIKKPDVSMATVIKSSNAHTKMVDAVNTAIRNGHGAGAAVEAALTRAAAATARAVAAATAGTMSPAAVQAATDEAAAAVQAATDAAAAVALAASVPYTVMEMGTLQVQNKLKLVAYMTNIMTLIAENRSLFSGGGGNKKKT